MYRIVSIIFIPLLLMATKYAGEFQELGVGGRACAMGGTGVAQFVDPSVIYFNPAGSFYADRGVLLMHAENFAGVVKNEFGSAILRRGNMSIGLGLQYISVSGIKMIPPVLQVVKIRQSLMTLLELKICFSTLMEQKVMINSRMAQI